MSESGYKIYLVDDDLMVLKGLTRLLRSAGYDPVPFSSARDFMDNYDPDAPGCLVLDVAMPGISGLDLQRWLSQMNSPLPIIFLTGLADIPTGVRAMKEGAVDFLTKSVHGAAIIAAIEEAAKVERRNRSAREAAGAIQARLATLTPREREVMEHVVSGQRNKQIAAAMGTVEKTIKVHRVRVMEKMGVQSIAELARIAERVGIGRAPLPGPPICEPPLAV